MPMYELGFPVSSKNLKITHAGVDYNIVESVFTDPADASTNLSVVSSNAGDNTQNIVIYGIVAGALVSESIALNGVVPAPLALDFTEVFEAYLDAVCAGIISISDSTAVVLGTIPIGRRVLSPDTFKRVGKDGNEVLLPLSGGCEFVGESLPGEFRKDWDADIVTFTARINGVVTGMLEMGGKSNAAGDLDYGWLNNHHPFVMMNDAELEVELEIPTSDTGAAAGEDIFFEVYIRNQKELITPTDDDNYLRVRFNIDENGLLLELHKRIAGAAAALLWDGSTADGNTTFDPAGDKFWIFKFVFHDPVAGAASPEDVRHMHVYAKHASTRIGLDTATEEELLDTVGTQASPYALDDLLFTVGYPAYQIISAHTTWFGDSVGSGNEAISMYLRTSYPALFALKYDFEGAEYGAGDVQLFDTKGSAVEADWQTVFDEDHDFNSNDVILENDLVRLIVDRLQQYGLEFYYWTGAAWGQPFDRLFFHAVTSNKDLSYPVIRGIESISPEKTAIMVRLHDSAAADNDYYIDIRITLERGKYSLKLDSLDVFPDQDVRFRLSDSLSVRLGFVGDDEIGDDDIDVSGSNITLTDNFLIAFDDAGMAVLGSVHTDEKPAGGTARFRAWDGGVLGIEDVDSVDTDVTIIWVSLIPFPLVGGLFLEAEDGTLGGAAARLFGEPAVASTWVRAQSANPADVGQVLTIIGDVGGVRTEDTIVLNGAAWVNGSEDFDRVYILKLSAVTAGNITVQDSLGNPIHVIPAGDTIVSNAVLLTAQNDGIGYDFVAGTELPAGRYMFFARMYDTLHVVDDPNSLLRDQTKGITLNEEGRSVYYTLGASYLYYVIVGDIPEGSVADLSDVIARIHKFKADANTIYVDYFLIIPIGDGRNWPQDQSHSALRSFEKPRRLYVR